MGVGPFYDAHCHYQDARLSSWFSDRGETVEELGVRKAVVNGTSPKIGKMFPKWLLNLDTLFFRLDCILGLSMTLTRMQLAILRIGSMKAWPQLARSV